MSKDKFKINIVHDFFNIKGGGERLVLMIADIYNSKIFTSFKSNLFNEEKNLYLPKFNLFAFNKKFFTIIYFLFIFKKNLKEEYFFFSGNYSLFSAKRVLAKKKILYIHSLPRTFFWFEYTNINNKYLVYFSKFLIKIVVFFYQRAFNCFDLILFNSEFTKSKLFKYYVFDNLRHGILYPFYDETIFNIKSTKNKNFALFNSRHELNKRILEVIIFYKKHNHINLKITNNGTLTKKIRKLIEKSDNIEMLSVLNSEDYVNCLKQCSYVIMIPKNEDFGMAAIEALACGKPVIASREGGLLEIFGNNYKLYTTTPNIENDNFEFEIVMRSLIQDIENKLNSNKTNESYYQSFASSFNTRCFKINFSNILNEISN